MSWRIWATAAVSAGVALGVGCVSSPPSTLTITGGTSGEPTTAGSGGSGPATVSSVASSTTGTTTATTGTSGGMTGHDMFVNTVYPELKAAPPGMSAMQACYGCHESGSSGAPVYLTADAEGSYNLIKMSYSMFIADPANSIFLNHGAHTGPAMYPQLQTDATAWIEEEMKEKGDTTTTASTGSSMTPVLTEDEALKQFASCMDYTEWSQTYKMGNLPLMETQSGQCSGCHSGGDGGNWLSDDVLETFTKNQMQPYIRRMVEGTVNDDGSFKTLVASHRWEKKGLEAAMCDPTVEDCHPQFTLTPDMISNIDGFVSSTMDKWNLANGYCNDGGTP